MPLRPARAGPAEGLGEKDLGREAELREKGRTHRLLTGRAGW